MKEEYKPATIRRPGAETKVGGSPLTTMGFKASPLAQPILLLVRDEDNEVSTSLRGWEGGGRGNEFRHSEAIALVLDMYHYYYSPWPIIVKKQTSLLHGEPKAPRPSIWYIFLHLFSFFLG